MSLRSDMLLQDEDEVDLDAYLEFCERALLDCSGRDSKTGASSFLQG